MPLVPTSGPHPQCGGLPPRSNLAGTGCDRGHAVISLFICVHFIRIDLDIPHISLQCVVLRCNEACDVVG